MIMIEHDREGYIVCRTSGILTKSDYDAAAPELENAIRVANGPLRVMIYLEDFRGWDLGGLWEGLKFELWHRGSSGKIAIVGETFLEEWGTRLSKPFSTAELRFFNAKDHEAARAWLCGEKKVDKAH